ncbi:hypothetical protein ACLOJK_036377 [Asimina triloba]
MASKTLRRRLHHADVNGRKNEHLDTYRSDSLSEPLLEKYGHDESYSEGFFSSQSQCRDFPGLFKTLSGNRASGYGHENRQDIWDEQRREHLHWTFIFSQLIAQWAQWFDNFYAVCVALLILLRSNFPKLDFLKGF